MTAGIYLPPGLGRHVYLGPLGSGEVKAGAAETGDAFCVWELTMRPGGPIPAPHLHHRIHEFFYVLAGEGQILLGDERNPAGPGVCFYAPPGVPHRFEIIGDRFRALVIATPASLEEQVVEAFGRLFVGTSPDAAKIASVFAGLDIEFSAP